MIIFEMAKTPSFLMKKSLLIILLSAICNFGTFHRAFAQVYCTPSYSIDCSSGDYIENFSTTLGTTNITNLFSGCNGNPNNYIDYSATQFVTSSPGNTFNFTIQSGPSWSQGHRIWIDYNDNGSFMDPGEDVWNSGFASTIAFTGSITIPLTASGILTMRVRCAYAGVPTDPCGLETFGEVEDYGLVLCSIPPSPTVVSPVQACINTTTTLSATAASGTLNWYDQPTGGLVIGTGNTFTTPVLTTVGTDTFWVAATNGGCFSPLIPIIINVSGAAVVALGNDTSICGTSFILDAGNVGATYLWSTGASTQQLNVTNTGVYSVTIVTPLGCIGGDAISVTINPIPVCSLGPDTTTCTNSIVLDAGAGFSSYSWTTGDVTQTSTINSTGPVAVVVTDANGCVGSDTAMVTLSPMPIVNLGPDISQCGGTATLDASNPGSLYFWSNSTSAQTTTVSATGTYSVLVVTPAGCSASDIINVTISNQPIVNLGPDTSICGTSITLNAGNPGCTYLWSTFATSQTINVAAGTFFVRVTNPSGCFSVDTIVVSTSSTPSVSAGANVTICIGQSTTLTATGALSYVWSTGATSTSITVSPTVNTTYYVTGLDMNGCSASDVVSVTVLPAANALFTSVVVGATGVFTNLSTNAVSYSWNFGDGSPANNSANPSHVYSTNGTYTVTLTVSGPCGSDTYTFVITISQVGLQDNDLSNTLSLFPNPNDGNFTLSFDFTKSKDVTVQVLDVSGRVVFNDQENNVMNYDKQIGLENAEQGMYFVRIITTDGVVTEKVMIQQ